MDNCIATPPQQWSNLTQKPKLRFITGDTLRLPFRTYKAHGTDVNAGFPQSRGRCSCTTRFKDVRIALNGRRNLLRFPSN